MPVRLDRWKRCTRSEGTMSIEIEVGPENATKVRPVAEDIPLEKETPKGLANPKMQRLAIVHSGSPVAVPWRLRGLRPSRSPRPRSASSPCRDRRDTPPTGSLSPRPSVARSRRPSGAAGSRQQQRLRSSPRRRQGSRQPSLSAEEPGKGLTSGFSRLRICRRRSTTCSAFFGDRPRGSRAGKSPIA